jgi:hypothetical protein
MHVLKGEHCQRMTGVASRKLLRALHEVNRYLNSQSRWLVDYAKRYRAGLRVGTSIIKGDGKLPGQSTNEQVATDALLPTRRRSPAPGSLCNIRAKTFVRCLRPHLDQARRP